MRRVVKAKALNSKCYVLGKKSFAAISAMEGLSLRTDSAERLERNRSMTFEERRAETIRAFSATRKRG